MLTLQPLLQPGVRSLPSFRFQQCYAFSKSNFFTPICMNLDCSGKKNTPTQVFQDTAISLKLPGPMDGNRMNGQHNENLNNILDYETAMEALSSLITGKKRGDISYIPANLSKKDRPERMLMYIEIMGLKEQMENLKIIHVAGTKGKGSTCTFCESILRECGFRTGMFTSPHLIDVRERFRLEGMDITEEKFLHYFQECWVQLKENVTDDLPMPRLFEFLTIMAIKIFVSEKVDVAIIEVGLGGTRDSTNVIKNPIVCGVSSLGMDHMESLGDTIGEIASQKAGIFKAQVPAFTVPQPDEAMNALRERAEVMKVPLKVVNPLDFKLLKCVPLSLSGDHQFTNARLAVALCQSWLHTTGNWKKLFPSYDLDQSLPEAFVRGLSTARLSGRAQIVHDSFAKYCNSSRVRTSGDLIFYLDGAHSPESMEACAKWFCGAARDVHDKQKSPTLGAKILNGGNTWMDQRICTTKNAPDMISKQILLFNCMDVRDPEVLLSKLFRTCASDMHFSKAIFVPSISRYNKVTSSSSSISYDITPKDLSWQMNLQRVWEKIVNGKDVSKVKPQIFLNGDASTYSQTNGSYSCSTMVSSLPSAINWLRNYVKENPSFRIQVLVTGSLHLVGDVLKLLTR